MVQVHVVGPTRKQLMRESVGQSIGAGLSNFINNYYSNKSLEGVLGSKEYEKAPPSQRSSLIERSLSGFGDAGAQTLQNRLGIEQQLQRENEKKQSLESSGKLKQALKDRGVNDDVADNIGDLYGSATEGGKTEILKNVLDMEKRGLLGNKPEQAQESGDEKYPAIEKPPGLTPKEQVELTAAHRKENFPLFNETQAKTKALKRESQSLNILDQINETQDLPEGAEKWNVDWQTGEARVPALLSPGAQRFLKTVNDFTTKAKDSYGGRVTNFELDRFMKRLPTLANSKEGRTLILQQMQLMNRLDSAYENELKSVFQHYGIGNIPYEDAVRIAEKNVEQEEAGIIEGLNGLVEQSEENPGTIQMITPDGSLISVPENEVEEAAKFGAKRK